MIALSTSLLFTILVSLINLLWKIPRFFKFCLIYFNDSATANLVSSLEILSKSSNFKVSILGESVDGNSSFFKTNKKNKYGIYKQKYKNNILYLHFRQKWFVSKSINWHDVNQFNLMGSLPC